MVQIALCGTSRVINDAKRRLTVKDQSNPHYISGLQRINKKHPTPLLDKTSQFWMMTGYNYSIISHLQFGWVVKE